VTAFLILVTTRRIALFLAILVTIIRFKTFNTVYLMTSLATKKGA